ncbi:potassium voltage-gated channel protein Shaw-like [Octopus sinensis]|uniref:Potassium voltage-gated channel protein Shaw-like n=1 Tax=Octopus sinensis TaxID=2607531 RepID=A0A6P7T688_9MOLL|nr:potassium voltage-gated channel protein Shaw-like [Octopus sinensis]XP_036365391.1 potassium voltage-gated channel protein Shaw-like [Octopus sinensis]XP_036365392.1 potassium voltage-gated channel protein Shaw-like [Octopus sinensis]XP_036365393.1 potassium voltage-gated channel protein Shaw-like [Octopus sinensis]XP_036365394.1 potassium voltage-gated channel protein Shaw-like [Octopus sinensis]
MTKNKVLNAHVLAALAPGAKVNFKTLEIAVAPDPNAGTLLLNVGGQIFETYRSTLNKHNNTNLSNEMFLQKFYRERHKDYFFDRDPVCFRSILEYLRTGQLHLPSNVCGPALKKELDFWGISENLIEGCCWNIYDSWNSTYESLLRFDRDRKAMFATDELDISQMTSLQRFKNTLWNILSNHNYSFLSKVYGIISLSFVIVSILTFIVETHPFFKTRGDRDILGRRYRQSNSTTNGDDPETEANMPHISIVFMDVICLTFFTLEFILRLICAPKKCKFFFTFLNMVDLAALLPDFIEIILIKNINYDFIFYITLLRLIRILRIFRLIRHIPGLWVMMYTLKASLEELMLMCIFLLVGMIIFASLIFFVGEDRFSNIPMSLWWALITMTTVGYGDMVPSTNLGYVVGSFCALTGLLMIGFTVPIIVNHFVLNYTHMQSATKSEMRQKHRQKELEEERKLMGELKAEFSESKRNNCKKPTKTFSLKKHSPASVWNKNTENGSKSEFSRLNELINMENYGNGISSNNEKLTHDITMEHKNWDKTKIHSSFSSNDDNEQNMDRGYEEKDGAKCKSGKSAKKLQSQNAQSFPMEEFGGEDLRTSNV